VGPAASRHLLAAGHEVAIAHTGAHEADVGDVEHLHGSREELLGDGGLVERWRPGALVDTFPGGATAAKAEQLAGCATRAGAGQVVAVSSMDVYEYLLDAGIGFENPGTPTPRGLLPVREDDPLRAVPYPGAQDVPGGGVHDNVAMEGALAGAFAGRVTALRPGAIYGPHPDSRERLIVEMVRSRQEVVALPDGGDQLFHRVAVDRVGRAVAAAIDRAPEGFWACNVGDPRDFTYGALVYEIGRLLGWEFRFEPGEADHPWRGRHPVLCDTRRLEDVLGVTEPDPLEALAECVAWLWEHEQPGRFSEGLRPAEKGR
jgi:nucleoside-diphosphate-sugar epimerase